MGVFGTGPFGSDCANEFIDGLYDKREAHVLAATLTSKIRSAVWSALEATDTSDKYYAARAAAQFVVLAHQQKHLPSLLDVVRLLSRMRADSEWLSAWRKPKKVAKALDEELSFVIATMRESGSTKEHMRNALVLARAASEVPVPKHPVRQVHRKSAKQKARRKR